MWWWHVDPLARYCGTIGTLAYSKDVRVTSAPPPGCAILTVSDKLSAHLLLKGLIEPAKEVEKLEKKKTALATTIEKLKKAAAVADYTAKVPEEVRAANQEKLAGDPWFHPTLWSPPTTGCPTTLDT